MVKDAALVDAPFLRAFGARYGYLLKCYLPVPKAKMSTPIAPKSPQPRRQSPSDQPETEGVCWKHPESSAGPRPSETHHPQRNRSPRGSRRRRGSRRAPRRPRSRQRPVMSSFADTFVERRVREGRMSARLAGEDSKEPLRDKCKGSYVGLGRCVPRHFGRARQDLGNKCFSPRHAPGCEGPDMRHWARNCPNRASLEARMRRN